MAEWRKYVKDYYSELKKTNPHALLKDAMKGAAKEWKKRGPSTKKSRKNKKGGEIPPPVAPVPPVVVNDKGTTEVKTAAPDDKPVANTTVTPDPAASANTPVVTPDPAPAAFGGKRKTKKRCRKSKKNAKKCK
jgi:hypothetical protein